MAGFSELLILTSLILINGFFSGAEVAVLTAPKQEKDNTIVLRPRLKDVSLAWLRRHPEKFFATVQICLTVVSSFASIYGGAIFIDAIHQHLTSFLSEDFAHMTAIVVVVTCISYFSLVLGELIPKSIGLKHCAKLAPFVAIPIYIMAKGLRPFVWFVTTTATLLTRPFTAFFEKKRKNAEFQQSAVNDLRHRNDSDDLSEKPRHLKNAQPQYKLQRFQNEFPKEVNGCSTLVPRRRPGQAQKRNTHLRLIRTWDSPEIQ